MSRALNTSYSSSMYNQEMKPLDYLYGPWDSVEQMLNELDIHDVNEIEPGLTVAVTEGDKVVEYWNPLPGIGFFKKTPGGTLCDIVNNYYDALEYAEDVKNILNLVYVKEETIIDDKSYGSGLYWVSDKSVLLYVASDLWYGVFPENTYEYTKQDEILPVNVDGAAKVSDVYRMFKSEQLVVRKELAHLNKHVHWMVEDLDKEEERKRHTFVNAVEQKYGKIQIVHNELDTAEILMDGYDETGTKYGDEVFVDVRGVNVGGYKNGSKIKKGDSLETVLKTIFTNELVPSDDDYEEPTVELVMEDFKDPDLPEDYVYFEVGTNFKTKLGYNFTDGKICTYLGAEDTDDGIMVDAGCTPPDEVNFFVQKPNEEETQILNTNIDEELVEGDYTYKVKAHYHDSTTQVYSNLGNPVSNHIPAGIATDEKSFKVRYKFYAGVVDKDSEISLDNLDEKWLEKNTTFEKRIKLEKNEKYVVVAPNDCDVIFDATGCGDISPVVDEDADVRENYTVWFMNNAGTYFNLRVISKE